MTLFLRILEAKVREQVGRTDLTILICAKHSHNARGVRFADQVPEIFTPPEHPLGCEAGYTEYLAALACGMSDTCG